MVNVRAYLDRIKYSGPTEPSEETLRALHRAHMYAVPFENLDISLRRKIVCDDDHSLRKIIDEQRGGFCYELNGAFAALLRSLGFQVTLLSARVARADGGESAEFAHLCLRVDAPTMQNQSFHTGRGGDQELASQGPWLADVGFGDNFVEPLRLVNRLEQPQFGRTFRLMEDGGAFQLEVMADSTWKKQYSFSLHPRELSDFSSMCHYQQTSPESHFTQQRICSLATPRGRITLSDLKLIETVDGRREERELSGEQEWRRELRQRFGIELPA